MIALATAGAAITLCIVGALTWFAFSGVETLRQDADHEGFNITSDDYPEGWC